MDARPTLVCPGLRSRLPCDCQICLGVSKFFRYQTSRRGETIITRRILVKRRYRAGPLRRRAAGCAHLLILTASLAVAASSVFARTGARTGDEILLVVNDSSQASRQIAEHYARVRSLPASSIVHLRLPVSDDIERAGYARLIETPIADWLTAHSARDRTLYIVLTKGVPLRVKGTIGPDGTVASVDSELTLLHRKLGGDLVPIAGHVPNPFFAAQGWQPSLQRFSRATADIYLVTRLDGYTVADAVGLVDRCSTPAGKGKIVLDQKSVGAHSIGDRWLAEAAELISELSSPQDVVLEGTPALAEPQDGVLGYYSWGSNDPAFRNRRTGMTFLPGAVAATFVSTDARTLREPPASWKLGGTWRNHASHFAGSPQSLAGDLIREGVTGVAGHVAEPYLDATVRPQVLFPAYLSGFNLAEAFYAAMPYLGWQTVVIGDPLCELKRRE